MRTVKSVLLPLLGLVALSGAASAAEFVYATGDGQALRFEEAGAPMSFEIKQDQKLEVVLRKNGQLRVRQSPGPKFGWVAESAVTTTAPAGAAVEAALPEGLPAGLDLQKLLQQQGLPQGLPMGMPPQ